ncbi:MAG: hypothetical protein HC902_07860 [Calothrix sp. SM1_5_4]|nr:hypothetical protein [Calothrix sp. SM1_5_4]
MTRHSSKLAILAAISALLLLNLTSVPVRADDDDEEDSVPAAVETGASSVSISEAIPDLQYSEYQHQTEAGRWEVTPSVGIHARNGTPRDATTTKKIYSGSLPLSVRGEYGISSLFSVGTQLGYTMGAVSYDCDSSTTCDSTTFKGFVDPEVYLNGRVGIGPGSLRFGANVAFSPMKAEISSNGDANNFSGGTTVSPYVGYEFFVGRGLLGFRGAYDLYQSEREVSDKTSTPNSYKVTDGQDISLAAFYEYPIWKLSIGSALEYTNSAQTRKKSNGATTPGNNAFSEYHMRVYVPIRFNPKITLYPALAVGTQDCPSSGCTARTTSITDISCAGRFTF